MTDRKDDVEFCLGRIMERSRMTVDEIDGLLREGCEDDAHGMRLFLRVMRCRARTFMEDVSLIRAWIRQAEEREEASANTARFLSTDGE